MQATAEEQTQESSQTDLTHSDNGKPVLVEPDLEFIRALSKRGGDLFKKCMQCGTCSATCAISPDPKPFPSKEMAWAAWGMKDRLLRDPDVWLCFHCNDCSTRCPRGARPGDVLSAIRQESVIYHSFPRFLGRWVNTPKFIPFLLGIPILLLSLALYLKDPIEKALGISNFTGDRIIYNYSNLFPHWLLNSFFLILSVLVFFIMLIGIRRFWFDLKTMAGQAGYSKNTKSLMPSIFTTLKNIIIHKNFDKCTTAHTRYSAHMLVFFGFIALSMVTLWVITTGFNPLIKSDFVYPFGFWSPWKLLANLGGLSLLGGLCLMIGDRYRDPEHTSKGSYFDWTLISLLFIVTLTGFITEILHYVRLEPHRHLAYFAHLMFICTLILYLPYSKFAHLVYRTIAMIYAEYSGRNEESPAGEADKNNETGKNNE
ncbi:quinone-interacting membrane-bound oxidoreductase complex subunit QmoC [candidate division KSB1 bacterium]